MATQPTFRSSRRLVGRCRLALPLLCAALFGVASAQALAQVSPSRATQASSPGTARGSAPPPCRCKLLSPAGHRAAGPKRDTPLRVFEPRVSKRDKLRPARAAILTFSLARPGLVRLLVRQEAPACVVFGRFTLAARAGLNRLRLTTRIGGRALPPGTYTIIASASRGRERVRLGRVAIVVVAPGLLRRGVAPPRTACSGRAGVAPYRVDAVLVAPEPTTAGGGGGSSPRAGADGGGSSHAAAGGDGRSTQPRGEGERQPRADASSPKTAVSHAIVRGESKDKPRVLGALFEDAPAWAEPVFLGALGVSILLLLVAALPGALLRRAPSAGVLIVDHRVDLAVIGVGLAAGLVVSALVL